MAWALELLGDTLAETEPQRAARLLGAAEALREALESTLEGIELALHEQALASLEPPTSTTRGPRAARSRPTTRPRSRSATSERLVRALEHLSEILVADGDAARPEPLQHRARRERTHLARRR